MNRSKEKTRSAAKRPATIPQPHGGALLAGGVPGHAGGPGRPPNEARKKLADILEKHGPKIVEDIMTGRVEYTFVGVCSHCGKPSTGPENVQEFADHFRRVAPSADTRLRAVDSAAKIGLGDKTELTLVSPDIARRVFETVTVIRDTLPSAEAERVLKAMEPIWKDD